MTKPTRLVVVTYREWLNWVSFGELRLNERTIKYQPPESDEDFFERLMKKAPVVSQTEDQAYVLALLKNKSKSEGEKWSDETDFPISLVISFHPMSSRGRSLLQGDANRAYVKLDEPLYEAHWSKWVAKNREKSELMAAQRLSQAFGLSNLDVKSLNWVQADSICDLLHDPIHTLKHLNSNAIEKTEKLEKLLTRGRKLSRQPAYGWWLALRVYKEMLEIVSPKKVSDFDTFARSMFNEILPSLQSVDIVDKPLNSNEAAKIFAEQLSTQFKMKELPSIHLLQLATIFHYQHTIHEHGTIELDSLGEDLAALHDIEIENTLPLATIAAHFIGRHLSAPAATGLHYITTAQSANSSISNLSNVIDIDRLPKVSRITDIAS